MEKSLVIDMLDVSIKEHLNDIESIGFIDMLKSVSLLQVAYHRIKTNPEYHGMWNWSFLLNLFMNNKIIYTQFNDIPIDTLVKIYDGTILRNYSDYENNQEIKDIVKQFIYCLASKILIIILGITENELETLPLLKAFSESPLIINFDQYISYSNLNFYDKINKDEENNDPNVSSEGQYSSVYDIYEIFPTEYLPEIFKTRKSAYQDIANTKTTLSNLTALSLAILKGDAILLTGPTGAGKSFCIQHLANVTNNNDYITVHLGDSSDAKLLLGTYVCTDKPGQFKWIPGMLTRAVKEGKWIVIEDIDLAPPEILSALLPVVEKRQLFIPSRGEVIQAKEGFQLFATKTISNHQAFSRNDSILSNLWRRVVIDPLSRDELEHVINVQFPEISILKSSIVETYFKLLDIFSNTHFNKEEITKENLPSLVSISTIGNRHISTRDVMKWCVRIKSEIGDVLKSANIVASNIREIVFREAIDCFCGSIPDLKLKDYMADIIRDIWNISTDRKKYLLNQYIPATSSTTSEFTVGRVTLPILKRSQSIYQHDSHEEKKSIYCYNRHSLLLLERIAQSIKLNEPVLLVGETGEGKTSTIQHLASKLNHKLVVLNLNQQSDSVDLLGGFKPVELKMIFRQLKESFVSLFSKTFSRKKNQVFLNQVHQAYMNQQWNDLIRLFKKAIALANKKYETTTSYDEKTKHKRQKSMEYDLTKEWEVFKATVSNYEDINQLKSNFAFSFVEGSLVKAVKEGHWVLLDEINLASHETLECLTGLLEGHSLTLNERGDSEPIKRHPSFRLIACMNPPTDVGKKDLPPALRNRFTEFIIHGLTDFDDLKKFVESHLESVNGGFMSSDIVEFYLKAKNEVTLTDGSNQRPHYSLRTLARALEYCRDNTKIYSFNRSLIDGITMSFTTQLSSSSYPIMMNMIRKCLIDKMKGVNLNQAPKIDNPDEYVQFEQFLLKKGPFEIFKDPKYILTPTISRQLVYLARILTTGKYPILLQGPTSSGKTSMIEYLAGCTGHRFVRINNHENTDVQEYIGHYISDSSGKLYFQEGILVEALRKGYWVVLDELNLAPSEVLESLNRLLDDNRELFIPETQETIKPHEHFMLFATQNPPGLYGGRKVLSRAFRNRFIEFHFDDIPDDELETILTQRCALPQSYCKKLILIMKDLQRHRQGSKVFAGRHGFVTLRDLFRWAGRSPSSYEELAKHGYFLLADRLRDPMEKEIVKEVLEKHLKVKIDENQMIDEEFNKYPHDLYVDHPILSKIVWTRAMKRMFVLIGISLRYKEPILLVGETGTGKTTVCQLHAYLLSQKLHIINCHEHTETADFIGGLRPVRGKNKLFDSLLLSIRTLFRFVIDNNVFDEDDMKEIIEYINESSENIKKGIELSSKIVNMVNSKTDIEDINIKTIKAKIIDYSNDVNIKYKDYSSMFTWYDGPLIKAMKSGDMILFDEISLAEDAILERLNSVLEPKRLLVIAEKGGENIEELIAHCDFRIMATMNPGGDFGKKELSPALRNRFTEVWIPHSSDRDDLKSIICERMSIINERDSLSDMMLDFIEFFGKKSGRKTSFSLRDILSWVDFILNQYHRIGAYNSYIHGAHLIVLDGLGITDPLNAEMLHNQCFQFLITQIQSFNVSIDLNEFNSMKLEIDQTYLQLGSFSISKGPNQCKETRQYTFECKTTQENLLRLLRALQLSKPILLEGNPGVGKTSIVEALGAATGHRVVRINLSDQTDMIDLLGADLPEENVSFESENNDPRFAWRDGVFLNALKNGDWVLLDEMNLANQSVLEGLNSVLDHRGTVFIPELGETFECPPSFRIFACQNPTHQGGGRKGLPKSFLNRFTKVYVNKFTTDDLMFISSSLYPQINQDHLHKMIEFNQRLYHETMVEYLYGKDGTPWEFNLRDILRWCYLIDQSIHKDPSKFVDILYLQRFRKKEDRLYAKQLFERVFNCKLSLELTPYYHISPEYIQIGQSILPRRFSTKKSLLDKEESPLLLQKMLNPLESVMKCVELGWFTILMGSTASGKSSLIKYLADITGNTLKVFSINSSIDTMELLGGFEQIDITRHKKNLLNDLKDLITFVHRVCIRMAFAHKVKDILNYSKRIEDIWQSLNQPDIVSDSPSNVVGFTDEQYNLMNQIVSLTDHVLSNYNEANDERESLGILSPSELRNDILTMKNLEKQSAYGSFEWVDGLLIQSLIRGDWIVMDNANLCPGPVLDRLLPLLEPNGCLQLNERGLIDGKIHEIRPHPNFRIFFTVDPQYGEISRAMRNRGIEIYLLDSDIEQLDNYRLIESKLHIGKELCIKMAQFHNKLASTRSNHNSDNIHVSDVTLSLRELLNWRDLAHTLIHRGVTIKKALFIAMEQVYVRCRYHIDDREAVIRLYERLFPSVQLDIEKLKMDSLAFSHIPPTNLYSIHSKPFVNELTVHNNDINRIIFSLSILLSKIGVKSLHTMKTLLQSFITFGKNVIHIDQHAIQWIYDVFNYFFNTQNQHSVHFKHFYRWNMINKNNQQKLSFSWPSIGHEGIYMNDNDTLLEYFQLSCDDSDLFMITVDLSKRLFMVLDFLHFSWKFERTTSQYEQSTKINDMNIIECSLNAKNILNQDLINEVIPFIYPFFSLIEDQITQWITLDEKPFSSNDHHMLGLIIVFINDLWESVHIPVLEFDLAKFSIQWRNIVKLLKDLTDQSEILKPNQSLIEYIDNIESTIQHKQGNRSKSLLRKDLGTGFKFKTQKHHELNDLFLNINNIQHLSYDMKLMVTQCLATIYSMNKESIKDEDRFKSFIDLSEKLNQEIHPLESELDVIYEYKSMRNEYFILSKVYQCCIISNNSIHSSDNEKLTILLKSLSKYVQPLRDTISYILKYTRRSPYDIAMYQLIIWIIEMEGKPLSKDSQIISYEFIVRIIQECLFRFKSRLLTSEFSNKIDWNFKFDDKASNNGNANEDEDDNNIFNDYGMLRLERNFISSYLVRLMRQWNHASVIKREEIKESLQLLLNELSPRSKLDLLNGEDIIRSDWLIQLSLLYSYIVIYIPTIDQNHVDILMNNLNILRENIEQPIEASTIFTQDMLRSMNDILSTSHDSSFKYAYDNFLKPSLELLYDFIKSKDFVQSSIGRGKIMIYLAMAKLYLIAPTESIDPNTKHLLKIEQLNRLEVKLKERIEILKNAESIFTGKDMNKNIIQYENMYHYIREQSNNIAEKSFERPRDCQPFATFFNDLRNFYSFIFTKTSVSGLLDDISSERKKDADSMGYDFNSINVREKHLQYQLNISIHGLKQYLNAYSDIITPILDSIMTIKRGFRIFKDTYDLKMPLKGQYESTDIIYKGNALTTIQNLILGLSGAMLSNDSKLLSSILSTTSFDHILKLKQHIEDVERKKTMNIVQLNVQILESSLFSILRHIQTSSHLNQEQFNILLNIFNIYVDIQRKIQHDEEEREREAQRLYKYRTRTITFEKQEEIDEKDYNELFPDYIKAYEEIIKATDMDNDEVDQDNNQQKEEEKITYIDEYIQSYKFTDDDIYRLCRAHYQIFSCIYKGHQNDDPYIFDESFSVMFKAISNLVTLINDHNFHPNMDNHLDFVHILSLKNMLDKHDTHLNDNIVKKRINTKLIKDGIIDSSEMIENFYTLSVPSESILVVKPLEDLKGKIDWLLNEIGNNEILRRLSNLIQSLLKLSLDKPLVQFMIGLEVLLERALDWESYHRTSATYSIEPYLLEIRKLVNRFRRKELNYWPNILNYREQQFQLKSSKWWFHLYGLLTKEEDITNIHSALRQFMESSSYGDFSFRLNLLLSFYYQFEIEKRFNPQSDDSIHVSDVLYHTYRYYLQFIPYLEKEVDTLKEEIEKDLKSFIKLTGDWNILNHYKLKESTEKSHRTLNKAARSYEEKVLSVSVVTLFGKIDSIVLDQQRETFKENISQNAYLYNYEQINHELLSSYFNVSPMTLKEMNEKIVQIEMLRSKNAFDTLEGIAVGIATHAASLKQKGTTSLKKRALNDLMKYLEHMGLTYHRSEVNLDQMNKFYLFSQEAMEHEIRTIESIYNNSHNQSVIYYLDQCNEYYYKNVTKLILMRDSQSQHSAQLTPAEVHKTSGYVEFLFTHLLNQRNSIIKTLRNHIIIQKFMKSFETMIVNENDIIKDVKAQSSFKSTILNVKQHVDALSLNLNTLLKVITAQQVERKDEDELREIIKIVDKCRLNIHEKTVLLYDDINTLSLFIVSNGYINSINEVLMKIKEAIEGLNLFLKKIPQKLAFKVIENIETLNSLMNTIENMYIEYSSSDINIHDSLKEDKWTKSFVNLLKSSAESIKSSIESITNIYNEVEEISADNDDTNNENDNGENENQDDQSNSGVPQIHPKFFTNMELKTFKLLSSTYDDRIVEIILNIASEYHDYIDNEENSHNIPYIMSILRQFSPLFIQFGHLHSLFLHSISKIHKSTSKLEYVLLNLFTNLYKDGFCVPEDEVEMEEGDLIDNVEGVGLGEGEGNKDITDQIKDEEEVLGEKTERNEQEETGEKPPVDPDTGLEMENDFDGEIRDVEKKEGENDDEDEDEDSKDIDNDMGEVDPNESEVVDEKVKDEEDEEEEGEDGNNKEEKYEKNAPISSKQDDSEIMAKPEDEVNQNDYDDNQKNDHKDEEMGEESGENDFPEINEDGEENYEDNHFKQPHKDEEEFELPENMEMEDNMDEEGANEDQEDEENEDNNENMDLEDQRDFIDDSKPNNDVNEGEQVDNNEMDDDENQNQEEGEDDQSNMNDGNNMVEEELNEEDKNEQGDEEDNNIQNGLNQDNNQNYDSTDAYGVEDNISAPQTNIRQMSDRFEQRPYQPEEVNQNFDQQQQNEQLNPSYGQDAQKVISDDLNSERNEKEQRESMPNPLRSLGDALKSWKRRLEVVDDHEDHEENVADENADEQKEQEGNEDSLYQYTHDDNEHYDNQTLGIASEEQAKEFNMDMDELQDKDEEENDDATKQNQNNEDEGRNEGNNEENKNISSNIASKDMKVSIEMDKMNEEPLTDDESMELEVEKPEEVEESNEDIDNDNTIVSNQIIESLASLEIQNRLTYDDVISMRQELEVMISKWRSDSNNIELGAKIWRDLQTLTSTSAQQLCEQLRLILEPTQKAKLKGDYRTGKRLNMRRVITYVASQFRKDKIWLRRMQPNKRSYQVMIALDDSESIELLKASHLVREATSMICIALQRLEIGQISIMKFGEDVTLLHPFSNPFTDEAASIVMPQLTFKQKSTNIEALLSTATQVMQLSRVESTNQNEDIMQIMFVIGDGRFGDKRHNLLKWLNEAKQRNIFIVFLIIDGQEKDQSILDIQTISYPNGKLTVKPYIDDFPFHYYIILKKLDNLPQVLADALRQWFEMLQR